MKRSMAAVTFAVLTCATAHAQDPDRNAVPPLESIFSGLIREQDVALALRYLRDSLDAVLEGREPPRADALVERGERIADELERRGAASARSMLDAIEAIVRQGVGEAPRLPPSSPAQRI